MTTEELQTAIESFAPPALQESWDNSGWNVNLHPDAVKAVMVCLDVTPTVVRQAEESGCNVIVSHHPLLFRPLRRLDTDSNSGRVLAALVAAGMSLYCAHTSADSTHGGINTWLGKALHLRDCSPLEPKNEVLLKLAVTVPAPQAELVRQSLTAAGAGALGEYADCTFSITGCGTFRPLAGAHPAVGRPGELETVEEVRIETLVPQARARAAVAAVRRAHPYEMPAIDLYRLESTDAGRSGLGLAGSLPEPVTLKEFADRVRSALTCGTLHIAGDLRRKVQRVGVCGGAGHDLIAAAERAGCDVFVTGELRHNSYFDYDIALVEAGHYDTEKCFVEIMCRALQMSEPLIQYKVAVRGFDGPGRPYIDY